MFALEPLDPTCLPTAETVYQGEWPFDREMFERALQDGVIEGRHSPVELPDEVDGYRKSVTRPRRHRLQYRWDEKLPVLGVIACNPSTATRRRLDDTLHLVVNQAKLWGFGGIDQGNLDPVYETNSRLIDRTADLADPINMEALKEILTNATVWLTWGNKPSSLTGESAIPWRNAEQHALSIGHRQQTKGTEFVVTTLNKSTSAGRAPAHASPRRFPRAAKPALRSRRTDVRIIER
jgi:hypothetical protein